MRKKILLITGREAEKGLREFLRNEKIPAMIHVSNVDVASFITPEILLREISKKNLKKIEKIIIPGAAKGDFSIIEKNFGITCEKGPKSFLSLGKRERNLEKDLKEAYAPKKFSFAIGKKRKVFLGSGISHVVAEINEAPKLSKRELIEKAKYYKNSGAEIIDIGMISNEDNSKKIPEIIEILRKEVDLPLSIDTLNENEILAAIDFGIDVIISLDFSNYEKILSRLRDAVVVLIPRDRKGKLPKKAKERVELMEKLMEKFKGKNFVVDLILEPINLGFSESLKAFMVFRGKYPEIPMMMGLGNLTEMMDVDSVGVNGLLAGIASELNVDLLLTTEASQKTKGCVRELSKAVKLMYLSKKFKRVPKDLGIDLLMLKEKRKKSEKIPEIEKEIAKIQPIERETTLEKGSEFRIFIDNEKIHAIYYKNKKPKLWFQGAKAEKIYKEILSRNLIKDLEHSAYLGKELAKAEIALKLGRGYLQDEALFS